MPRVCSCVFIFGSRKPLYQKSNFVSRLDDSCFEYSFVINFLLLKTCMFRFLGKFDVFFLIPWFYNYGKLDVSTWVIRVNMDCLFQKHWLDYLDGWLSVKHFFIFQPCFRILLMSRVQILKSALSRVHSLLCPENNKTIRV